MEIFQASGGNEAAASVQTLASIFSETEADSFSRMESLCHDHRARPMAPAEFLGKLAVGWCL